jgi:hypothetical protein
VKKRVKQTKRPDATEKRQQSMIKPLQPIIEAKNAFGRLFLNSPNIRSVGVGRRRKDGEVTDETAVVFFVEQKRSRSKLHGDLIPPRLPLVSAQVNSSGADWVCTDVQECGVIRAAIHPQSGDRIDLDNTDHGTTGIVFKDLISGRGFALTCGHVLDPDGRGSEHAIRIASNPPVPARSPIVLPLRRGNLAQNSAVPNIDAGICEVMPDIIGAGLPLAPGALSIARMGTISSPAGGYELFSRMLGRISQGSNPNIEQTVQVDLPVHGDWTILTDAFSLDIDAMQGDSGSLLFRTLADGSVEAIGMLVAVADTMRHAWFHPIDKILSAFSDTENLPLRLGVTGDVN